MRRCRTGYWTGLWPAVFGARGSFLSRRRASRLCMMRSGPGGRRRRGRLCPPGGGSRDRVNLVTNQLFLQLHAVIAVIFEVLPASGRLENYLEHAARLRGELDAVDGFISIERFQSLTDPDKILSLSFWRDVERRDTVAQSCASSRHAVSGTERHLQRLSLARCRRGPRLHDAGTTRTGAVLIAARLILPEGRGSVATVSVEIASPRSQ